jgi:hypothetical protein
MFCFVIPFNEEDKKIYELVRQETSASVMYNSEWLISSRIFEANYFLYGQFEAKHQGMLSLDVIIVKKGNLERHMASRYVIKYESCVTLEGAVRRDTTGCRHMGGQFECKHVFYPCNHLMGIMQSIYHYLYREGFTRNPNHNFMYHMRELCEEYDTVVSKYLIEQFISAITLLHKNTMILYECECNLAEDCVCKRLSL